ncbi:MAG: restriction endonuclease [Aquificaceae bacterium]|nr:restriction endonuclease [Aquificaceae bacterium]
MPVPQARELIDDVFRIFADFKEHSRKEVIESLREMLKSSGRVNEEELEQRLRSGMRRIDNRIAWALTFISIAGLVTQKSRGVYIITERGKRAVEGGSYIDLRYLMRFREFSEWYRGRGYTYADSERAVHPEEQVESAYRGIIESLKRELLEKLKKMEPYSFEKVVSELLKKMGYGEPVVTSITRDGGIDAIIKSDKLGLDEVYIQAKRWGEQKLGVDVVRNFIGSPTIKGASMDVIIATSSSTEDTKTETSKLIATGKRIALIDGKGLAKPTIEHNVGVYTRYTYEIKAIDENFFEEV